MNKVVLIGRITRDPEIKYTPSGKACLGFTIAVNREFRDNNGEIQSDFISCMAWGSQAEYISKYVKKGYMLGVGGRIQTRQYQAPDGQMKYITEVLVENVENLTPRQQEQAPQPQPQQETVNIQKPQPKTIMEQIKQAPPQVFTPIDDEDLPF